MQKPGRNDPCLCGSGKKYKKCCGATNVIEFNPHAQHEELYRYARELEEFAFKEFEEELFERAKYYTELYLHVDSGKNLEPYYALLTPWVIMNEPLGDGSTIFERFYAQKQHQIKNTRLRDILFAWRKAESGVYQIISAKDDVHQPIQLQNIMTDEIHHLLRREGSYRVGDYMIGVLLPYVNTNDFLSTALIIDLQEEVHVLGLLDMVEDSGIKLNKMFPEFAAKLLFPEKVPLEWSDVRHEAVVQLFVEHMTLKEMDKVIIQYGVEIWYLYCNHHDPDIRKPGAYAAALDYLLQSMFKRGSGVTQAEIAVEYGTSAGTVSNNSRKLDDFFETVYRMHEEGNAVPTSTPSDLAPFSPFGMEKEMRHIEKFLEGHDFDSEEELTVFLNDLLKEGQVPETKEPRDIAQDLLEQAYMEEEADQNKLIEQALTIDPNNADAYVLLANLQQNELDKQQFLERAIRVGKKELGEVFFQENKGYFWGMTETRPYMRAKQAYALFLEEAGFAEEAIAEYEDLLELNSNDNQGNRYLLLPLYIATQDYVAARDLLQAYDGEGSAAFLFNKALVEYLTKGITDHSIRMLEEANEANPYVLKYLSGKVDVSLQITDYFQPGEESEAVAYVQGNIHLWTGADTFLQQLMQKK